MRAVVGPVDQAGLGRDGDLLQKRAGGGGGEAAARKIKKAACKQLRRGRLQLQDRVQPPGGACASGLAAHKAGALLSALELAPVGTDDVHIEQPAHGKRLLDLHAQGLDALRRRVYGKIALVAGGQAARVLLQNRKAVLRKAQPKLVHAPQKRPVGGRRQLDRPSHIHGKADDRRAKRLQQGCLDLHPLLPGQKDLGQCDVFLLLHGMVLSCVQ